MQYYEQNDKRGRRWGILFVMLYLAACVGIMFITHTIALPQPEAYILVELREVEAQESAASASSASAETEATSEIIETVVPNPIMTTEEETYPEIAEPPVPTRKVNQQALFRRPTTENASTSQSTSTGGGSSQGTHDGSGVGGDYSLDGRGLGGNGSLPKPTYHQNEEGKIVINIIVDRQGNVIFADYQPINSTIPRGTLSDAAVAAAKKTKFVVDENAPERQFGTIIYTFKQMTQ